MPSLDRLFALSSDMLMAASMRDGLIARVNQAACRILGWSKAELLSRPYLELIHPDDRDRAAAAAVTALAAGEMNVLIEHRMLCKDGSQIWTEWHGTYFPDDDLLYGIGRDISGRRRMEEALRVSQAHFEAVANLVPDFLWRSEPDGTATWANEGWRNYHGLPLEALGDGGWVVVHPDDVEASRRSIESAFESKAPVSYEYRIRRSDGIYRWFLARMHPLLGSDGAVSAWFGAATDIDDLKRSQGQQRLLIAELQHRTRNLLGIVRSMASQTMKGSSSLDAFADRFNSRLGALSRVQSFLSQSSAVGVRELLHAELAAHGIDPNEPRVILEGPSVELPTASVQPLALGLHELTTNALKHGAFATPSGCLAVRWSIAAGENPSLVLEWRESGVLMPDHDRPMRRGFGIDLIERGLPYQLGTTTRMAFSPGGLICNLVLPITHAGPGAPASIGKAFLRG